MAGLRPIDHLVLPVESLSVARARYVQLGFQVQPDRRHPFGTENCCVMFANNTYLEPLAVARREDAEHAIVDRNMFVQRQDAYRFRYGEGFAMLALRTSDATADHRLFCDLGYASGEPYEFERLATAADGSETRIGVRLAFAEDHRAPDCLLFACQHLAPEILWNSDNVVHPNNTSGVSAVFLSEPNPSDFQYYLAALTGQREIRASSAGIDADTGQGTVFVLTPDAMSALFGIRPDHQLRGLRLRGFLLSVPELEILADRFRAHDVEYREHGSKLIVDPAPGQGSFIAFQEDMP